MWNHVVSFFERYVRLASAAERLGFLKGALAVVGVLVPAYVAISSGVVDADRYDAARVELEDERQLKIGMEQALHHAEDSLNACQDDAEALERQATDLRGDLDGCNAGREELIRQEAEASAQRDACVETRSAAETERTACTALLAECQADLQHEHGRGDTLALENTRLTTATQLPRSDDGLTATMGLLQDSLETCRQTNEQLSASGRSVEAELASCHQNLEAATAEADRLREENEDARSHHRRERRELEAEITTCQQASQPEATEVVHLTPTSATASTRNIETSTAADGPGLRLREQGCYCP